VSGLVPVEPEHPHSEPALTEAHAERVASAPAERAEGRPAATQAIPSLPARAPAPNAAGSAPEAERGEETQGDLTLSTRHSPVETARVEPARRPPRRAAQPELVAKVEVTPDGARKHALPDEPLDPAHPRRRPPRASEPGQQSEAGLRPANSALVPSPSALRPTVGEARLPDVRARRGDIDQRDRMVAKSPIIPAFAPLPRHEVPRLRPNAAVGGPSAPSAPTIHVTIGRVEVRAVQSQPVAAARQPRPAGPRLSLDEYLRQRAGGGK
jgi:hypothetical protein